MAEENNKEDKKDNKKLNLDEIIAINERVKTISCNLGALNKLLEEGRQTESKKILGETAFCIINFSDDYPNSVLIDYYKHVYQRAHALYQLKFGYRGC